MALTDQDESVRIAVRALGDMRNSALASPSTSFQPTPALSVTSSTSSPSLPSPSITGEESLADEEQERQQRTEPRENEDTRFVSRVSNIPIVNSALRAYEHSKASSRVVKYGAEMMESSVKSISRPVIERLPVGQIDEFACRQLDKLGNYARRASSTDRGRSTSVEADRVRDHERHRNRWETRDESMSRTDSRSKSEWEGAESAMSSAYVQSRTPTPLMQPFQSNLFSQSRNNTQLPSLTLPPPIPSAPRQPQTDASDNQQVAQRSRWQAMLLEAGGIGAAVSEESMRRLKYCLQWLQYATAHLDAQILVLRNFIASLQPSGSPLGLSSGAPRSPPITPHHLRTLQAAKRDVVETLRQVVDVVSRYAGGALPEPARSRVRSFILCLPRRWAAASGVDNSDGATGASATSTGREEGLRQGQGRGRVRGTAPYSYGPGEPGPSPHSRPASRATSPTSSRGPTRAHSRQSSGGPTSGGVPPTADAATQAAQRVLTLATESLDMLRGVTSVFKDSLDRAEAWVERLRVVGLQRQQSPNADVNLENDTMLDFRNPNSHLPSFPHSQSRARSPHSPPSPASPFVPLSPVTPGTAPGSGHSTPFFTHSTRSGPGYVFSGSPFDIPSPAGGAAASFDALTLSSSVSVASSRFVTPKSVLLGLPPEGDAGGDSSSAGYGRGEKRRGSDDTDAAVVAATALAGLAGSGVSAKRVKQEERDAGWRDREVGMDVDS